MPSIVDHNLMPFTESSAAPRMSQGNILKAVRPEDIDVVGSGAADEVAAAGVGDVEIHERHVVEHRAVP